MLDQKSGVPKTGQRLLAGASRASSPRQRHLMLGALLLLLVSLAVVLYRDRDFWFPETQDADVQLLSPPEAQAPPSAAPVPAATNAPQKKTLTHKDVRTVPQLSNDPPSPGLSVTATRSVLPPLEVEVVAGDTYRTVRPGSNAIHVDLQRAAPRHSPAPVIADEGENAAGVTAPAAQRTSISTDAAASIVTRSVQPAYPRLARQMRVQGSVVLEAMIGPDGLIQNLRVLSGPPILATAAQEAVRQWHFKPHFLGTQAVETRASITVNFTISTN